jgi:hypothetical protein
LLPQEGVGQRAHVRFLFVVGRAAVAAFDVFVVAHVGVPARFHLRHHLARVAGVDAVVAGGGGEQHRRIIDLRLQQVVRREGFDEFPVLGVRIAVFGHPRGAGQQVAVALHVEQRHLTDHRAEQLRVLHDHVAHQQAAVAAALRAEVLRRGDLAREQVFGDRREILVRLVAIALSAAWCQRGPYSPPPRMLASTYTPPFSASRADAAIE